MFGLQEMLADLKARLNDPANRSATGKLVRGILADGNVRSPMQLPADDFNTQAEIYYRDRLRRRHLAEAFEFLIEDLRALELEAMHFDGRLKQVLHDCLPNRGATQLAIELQACAIAGDASEEELRQLINLMLLSIHQDLQASEKMLAIDNRNLPERSPHAGRAIDATPVC